jgi:rubrerythrin
MKLTFENQNDVMNFAIEQEEEASIFYEILASKTDQKWLADILKSMAEEETRHKNKLEDLMLNQGQNMFFSGKIDYLGISDRFEEIDPFSKDDIGYGEALIIAMKNEEAALKLYLNLAKAAKTKEVQNIFLALAEEEGKHKMHFEKEYSSNKKAGFIA